MKKLLLLLVYVISCLAQAPEGPSSIALSASAPSGVNNVFVSTVGVTAQTAYCYWVVAVYPIGMVVSQKAACLGNSNGTLTGGNYNTVSWQVTSGVTGYWVIRSSNSTFPSGGTVAVNSSVLGAGTNTLNDQSNTLNSFTYTSANYANAHMRLDNGTYSFPKILTDTSWTFATNNVALGNFNAFDQNTANGRNLFLDLNPITSWSPVIGMQESNNIVPDFSVGGYFQSSSTNATGAMPNVIGAFGEGDSFTVSPGTTSALGGVEGLTENHGTGPITIQSSLITYNKVDSGSSTINLVDMYTQGHVILGTVTNNYGIYLADVVGGTTINQAIHTNAGWNFFGDVLSVGNTAVRPNNLIAAKGTSTGMVSLGWVSDAPTYGCMNFINTACALANYNIAGNGTDVRVNSPAGSVVIAVNNVAQTTMDGTSVVTSKPTFINSGTNILYRCTVAGTLRVGQTTTASGDCGTAVDTGLRVN